MIKNNILNNLRIKVLNLSRNVQALHIGSAFSCIDIVYFIYKNFIINKDSIFIMSKGHGYIAQLVVLNHFGLIREDELQTYCTPDGKIGVHPDRGTTGVIASTGSLGHGLGIGLGIAIGKKLKTIGKQIPDVYVLISDGELQEGSTWEAILFSASVNQSNLVCIIDNNDFQSFGRTSETHPSMYPIEDKFQSFGWEVQSCDGHNLSSIEKAFSLRSKNKPFVLVCKTVKGKGVSFMENQAIWHYRSPNKEEYDLALYELSNK